ncbi:MAG: hypothetical protein HYZ34_07445, partial [Ignavibacteriae bacterium]|nr:hypothetical protein [Ignavibacteriota bacterium]
MPDTRDSSLSRFTITVRDTSTFSTKERTLNLSIAVSGPNGIAHQTTSGTLLATGGGRTRLPGSIALISTSENEIQVTGTGGTETSTMIFEIRDSLGVPVDSSYLVRFTVMPSLGGAFISPDSGYSDPQTGRITSVIHSGTVSGSVQVMAIVIGPSGTIMSSPMRVLIHAGPPDQAHLTVAASRLNVPGWHIAGVADTILAIVGDKYANPVPEGTAIYFTSSIGVITTNTGFTDNRGMANVILYSGNPRSSDGFGWVTAQTVGENGIVVTDSTRVLFSGHPIIDSLSFNPDNTTDFTANFRVYDVNENPISNGNEITITIDGDVSLKVSRIYPSDKLPDTQSPFWTNFAVDFRLNLEDAPDFNTGPFTATITVSGVSGTTVRSFVGVVEPPTVPIPTPESIAGIELLSMTESELTVRDVGGTETSTLTYQILDSSGLPLSLSGVKIAFLNSGVAGVLTPDTGRTNSSGQVSVTFRSDTVVGTAQVSANVATTPITSLPAEITIVGGSASLSHMTLMLTRPDLSGSKVNFPGATLIIQKISDMKAQIGDQYGNPVPESTLVFFTSDAGVIQNRAWTDAFGIATAEWYGGNPIPAGGNATVSVSARGISGSFVVLSEQVTYSGQVMIGGGPQPGFEIIGAGSTTFGFTVRDANGNPPAEGSRVLVSVSGSGANAVVLSGDVNVTMPDTRDSSLSRFTITVR